MLTYKHRTLIILAGLVWFFIGLFLLTLGIRLILKTVQFPELAFQPGKFSLIASLSNRFANRHNIVVAILSCSLFVGYLKGRFMLAKSAQRQVNRILSLPNPAPLKYLYSKGYYLLIGLMMLLGMTMRWLPITYDTRGAIDVTVGAALINGAMLYFRQSVFFHRQNP